jgi:peptidoglycan/LPS O-acetylase OafA/YrhL
MIPGRVARAAEILTFALLLGALVFLQVVSSQKDLLPHLEAYLAIAVAGLIAAFAGTTGFTSRRQGDPASSRR